MKRFILVIVALAFAAVLSSTNLATAKPGKSGGSNHPGDKKTGQAHDPKVVNTIHPIENKGPNKNFGGNQGHGHEHRRGRDYRNWSRYCWFPECGALRLLQRR